MFRFELSGILWFLVLIPLLFALFAFVLSYKKRKLEKHGTLSTIKRLFPEWSIRKEWFKSGLILVALALLLISWSNPQWGNRKQTIKVQSSDVVIALDISQSMLAQDISPNRMERAKFFVSELIKRLHGDRIGLIYFAGSAYLQMPLTDDLASAQTFVKSANPNQAGTQGTVIADAIELSETLFGENSGNQKALIIISDGENHETEAIEAARTARSNGIYSYTLGIGTSEGAFIPMSVQGNRVYKTDAGGNAVRSSLNADILKEIADAGGGKFYMIDQSMSALRQLDEDIEKLEKQEVEQRSFTDFNSYFQYFIFCAIVLLILEFFLTLRKTDKTRIKKILGI